MSESGDGLLTEEDGALAAAVVEEEPNDGSREALAPLAETEMAPVAVAVEEPASWGGAACRSGGGWINQEELPNLCTMCQGAHRTMDCPKPRCWVCCRQQAPYHWPKSCTSATCEICRSKHHKFFCPMNPDRPCARCGKWGHIAPACSAASTLPCDLCQPSDHTIAACPIPRCMRCLSLEHLESGCPSGERHGTGSGPPAMCFNCHQPGHSSWECSREVVCNKCGKQATTRITAPILKSRRCTAAVPVVREATFSGIALCTRPHPHHLVCLVSLPLRPTSSRALAAVALSPGFLAAASRAAGSVSQMTGDRPWCLLLQQQNV